MDPFSLPRCSSRERRQRERRTRGGRPRGTCPFEDRAELAQPERGAGRTEATHAADKVRVTGFLW